MAGLSGVLEQYEGLEKNLGSDTFGQIKRSLELVEQHAATLKDEKARKALLQEIPRTLHRIQCLVWLRDNKHTEFSNAQKSPISSEQFSELKSQLSIEDKNQFRLNLFLTVVDGLKKNKMVTEGFEKQYEGITLPTDPVQWLAAILKEKPEVFEECKSLLGKNQQLVKDTFANFIHFRHILLGENPLKLMIPHLPEKEAVSLMTRFWLINAFGFSIQNDYGAGIGATLTADHFNFYQKLQRQLESSGSLEAAQAALTQLYIEKASKLTGQQFNGSPESTALAQLVCMLSEFEGGILTKDELKAIPTQAITECLHHLQPSVSNHTKLTFLPKLLLALKKTNPNLSAADFLKLSTCLIAAIKASAAEGQTTMPLFSLSEHQDNKEFRELAPYLPAVVTQGGNQPALFEIVAAGGFENLQPTVRCMEQLHIQKVENIKQELQHARPFEEQHNPKRNRAKKSAAPR